jgi:hypothetical protein
MEAIKTKFKAGKYLIPVTMIHKGGRIIIQFQYNKILIEEVKAFDGAKWEPEGRYWHIPDSQRNRFQLEYLQGRNPYANYDLPLVTVTSNRSLFSHQLDMVAFGLTRHYCLFAASMGTGKTLVAIEIMEAIKDLKSEEAWYVGPVSGVRAVELELLKWQCKVWPRMMTYEGLTKEMKTWESGRKAPRLVIFDECSKIKTPTAQRSQAAMALANGVRNDWGDEGYVLLLSGTPAPRSPVDWWNQCLADDTWITTTEGPRQIKDLINVSFDATVQGRVAHSNGFFKTGTKQLYKVTTKQGYMIRCTEEERFLTDYDGLQMFKPLSELSVGDNLVVSDCGNREWNGFGTYIDGYLIGQLIGDGTVNKTQRTGILIFYSPDFCIIPFIKSILIDYKIAFNAGRYNITSNKLNQLVRLLGFSTDKYICASLLKETSSYFLRGLVSGLFDSDGTVETTRIRIAFATLNWSTASNVQLILNSFQIKSTIYKCNFKEGYINSRLIKTEPIQYRLIITNEDVIKFHERIGFNHPEKRAKLITRINNRHTWATKSTAEIVSIEKDKIEDVYDCTIEDIHMFTANGLVVHNCEVACPGFLKEGNIHKFRSRLAIVEERENMLTGGKYPHLIGWRDSDNRCECGLMKEDPCHDLMRGMDGAVVHPFKAGKNEVAHLHARMNGLVIVKLKEDCLDLPDKIYRIVNIKPTADILRLAKHIKATQSRAITVLTLLRELSDGFIYKEVETGEMMQCPRCKGTCKVMIPVPREEVDTMAPTKEVNESQFEMKEMPCDNCSGTGQTMTYTRGMDLIPCPKDEQLKMDLDDHEELGRLIIWGAFTGSIDKIVDICKHEGWSVLRIDGRGFIAFDSEGKPLDDRECLIAMDGNHPRKKELLEKHPKLVVVAHVKAGGMALTLTASPTEIFFSNDFSGEGRMQSEDRAHRPGMDLNRGLTIVDYVHLPSDQYVLDNLKKKKDLQKISMGELDAIFKENV